MFFEESWNFSWKSVKDDKGLRLEISLPGYGKEDLMVHLVGDKQLHVKTKDGSFEKKFLIRIPVASITSTMVNGILKIDCAEVESSDSIKEIDIK